MKCHLPLAVASLIVAATAVSVALLQRSVWWAGYDLRNCPGCEAKTDWSMQRKRQVSAAERQNFVDDGFVVLSSVLPADKVNAIAHEVDNLPNTIMTDVIARFLLKFYKRYEHRLDTRSELVRDWAVHGPLGKWAAELLSVPQVRLYNAEAIYHKGPDSPVPCKPAWHRDTIAAPFDYHIRAVTFNVYFEDISADGPHGDGLIYMRASHKSIASPPPPDRVRIAEPVIQVGDVLAHDPNIYHTTSGRGCWQRRSLQFRYVAAVTPSTGDKTRLSFGPNRLPHGPVPWTLAHAPGVAPHGLQNGDILAGPWYPLVYPSALDDEHIAPPGPAWGLRSLLKVASESVQLAHNGTTTDGMPQEGAFFGMDGLVASVEGWAFVSFPPNSNREMLFHKRGESYRAMMKSEQ